MKYDPYVTKARFPSVCHESKQAIAKGDPTIYYPRTKAVFKIGVAPKAERDFRTFQSLAYEEDNGF